MRKKIKGRVIRIIDAKTLVINLGQTDGISYENIFSVLATPEQVVDPVSKEELGLITIVKVRVKPTKISERFTIATSQWTRSSPSLSASSELMMGAFGRFASANRDVDEGGPMKIDQSEVIPWKAMTAEEPVRVNDEVEVVVELKDEKEAVPLNDSETPITTPSNEGKQKE